MSDTLSALTAEIVTNCDIGPGCGMFGLLQVLVVVAISALVIGILTQSGVVPTRFR